jgi:putative flippase GtrA
MKAMVLRHKQKLAYLAVGGWNTVFGIGSFSILYYLFSGLFHYSAILTLSYIMSITNAYVCYKLFVFRTKGNIIKEYLRFYVVYGASFIINLLLFPVFTKFIGINAYYAQVVITAVIVAISYVSHKNFSFRT